VGPVITPGPSEFNSDRCHRPWVNISTNESECGRPANHNKNHFTTQRARGTCRTITVVQCDQTSFLATSMMLLVTKRDDRYKGKSSFLSQMRYNMETVLIVLVVLFLLGGGGWGYSRWRA
jgi:hypothetical protein